MKKLLGWLIMIIVGGAILIAVPFMAFGFTIWLLFFYLTLFGSIAIALLLSYAVHIIQE